MSKKVFQSKEASVYYDAEKPSLNLKIIVTKKTYKLAVKRNKAKRWVKEIFQKTEFGPGYVVVVRRGFLDLNFDELRKSLTTALGKNLD